MPDLAPSLQAPALARITQPDTQAAILQDIRNGVSARAAAIKAGINPQTWYAVQRAATTGQWPDGTPAGLFSADLLAVAARFIQEIAHAEAEWEAECDQTFAKAIRSPAGTVEWRAAHEWKKHSEATRKRWHEYRELKVEQTGRISLEHRQARQLGDDELIEALPGEWSELCEPLQLPEPPAG